MDGQAGQGVPPHARRGARGEGPPGRGRPSPGVPPAVRGIRPRVDRHVPGRSVAGSASARAARTGVTWSAGLSPTSTAPTGEGRAPDVKRSSPTWRRRGSRPSSVRAVLAPVKALFATRSRTATCWNPTRGLRVGAAATSARAARPGADARRASRTAGRDCQPSGGCCSSCSPTPGCESRRRRGWSGATWSRRPAAAARCASRTAAARSAS